MNIQMTKQNYSKDENHKDTIYAVNCPKCNYDMFGIYNKVFQCLTDKEQENEYCRIR